MGRHLLSQADFSVSVGRAFAIPSSADAMACLCCQDTGWICEAHPDQPFRHDSSAPWKRFSAVSGVLKASSEGRASALIVLKLTSTR